MRVWLILGCVSLAVIGLAACAPQSKEPSASSGSSSGSGASSSAPVVMPSANAAGVITAQSWQELYPHEFATYQDNAQNSTTGAGPFPARGNMIEMYPQITTIWAGNGFSKSYNEPNGHQYALDDVRATGRVNEKTLANCLTCKSADFTAAYQKQGDAIFTTTFAELSPTLNEPISCYNCHQNDPLTLSVTQDFFAQSMGADATKVPLESQVCGQCHNEYYFDPETKAVRNPYNGVKEMTPEAIYQYYSDINFSDATNEATGISWLKIQHPEFEFVYGGSGSPMARLNNPDTKQAYTCADCHMGSSIVDEDGTIYRSHLLVSPLKNTELLNKCNNSGCHTDLAAQVKEWQEESEGKVQSVGDSLVTLNQKIAPIKDSVSPEVQALYREAQFYWEFVMVENSEGAHNPDLSNNCLDRAQKLIDQAMGMLA